MNAEDRFRELLRNLSESEVEDAPSFDPETEIREWRSNLDRLYGLIRDFLSVYIDKRQVQFGFETLDLDEEELGQYQVNTAVLRMGGVTVRFEPIGTMLIGSKGRVDMIGPSGRIAFTLARSSSPKSPGANGASNVGLEWKIVVPAGPQILHLNSESFFQALTRVVGD